jgi:hypothetical protein
VSPPPIGVQTRLFKETLGLLASYSWQSTVILEPAEFGRSDVDLSLPEFIREFRLRHAIATSQRLHDIVAEIEAKPSRVSGVERAESRGVIRGRLDTPRYMARRATLRSLPRRYPVVRSTFSYQTPENALTRLALGAVRAAMRDSPFPPRSAEGLAAGTQLRWATDRLRHRPWDEISPHGLRERLQNEVEARVRRRQTTNDSAYRRLLDWYRQWTLDLEHLGDDARDALITGLLAFPGGDAFWDKVFEVWCLVFVASALDALGWDRIAGPSALHQRSGVIFRYRSPDGQDLKVRFQRTAPLPNGRWNYRDGNPLRGIPDVSIGTDMANPLPLLIDAKNRYISSDQIARSEETYKMLGYAENFRPELGRMRFRGVLIFPSGQDARRIIDGPEDSRLDLVTVDLAGDKSAASEAVGDAISAWVSQER